MPRTYRTRDDVTEGDAVIGEDGKVAYKTWREKSIYPKVLDHSEEDLKLHHLASVGAALMIFIILALIVGMVVS